MIEVNSFKTRKKDVTILWESQRNLSAQILSEKIEKAFPSFNVEIFGENDFNIIKYENIPSSNELGSVSLANEQARSIIVNTNPAIINCNPRKRREFFINQNFVKNNFTFSIEENHRIFKENNGFDGFYDKFFVKITHNDSFQISYACLIEYDKFIDESNFSNSISKVYRSSDNLSLKIKFNPDIFYQTNINSFVIKAKAINGTSTIDLNPIFIEDINTRWLDTVENTKILTLPFLENEIVEESPLLNIEIYPLLPFQTAIMKLIKSKEEMNLFISRFLNHKINYNNLYKSGSILEALSFQGYFYLFNPNSYQKIAWPNEDYIINNVKYFRYFPRSKNSENINTICLNNPPVLDSSILEISNIDLDESLGYYNKDQSVYYDVLLDLPYFKHLNILNIKIIDIAENESEYIAYIEFRTSLISQEDIVLNNISSDLSYERKYYENIDDINYLCLLFSLKNSKFNDANLNNDQLIKEKKMISFSFRYNN